MRILDLVLLETRQLRRDRLFCVATLVASLALLYGLMNGQGWSDDQRAQIARYETQTQEDFDALRKQAGELRAKNEAPPQGLTERNGDPRYALGFEASFAQHACRRPDALAALGVGQSDLYNSCILSSAWDTGGEGDEQAHRTLENPLRLLFGRFDAAFVAIALLPIAILVIAYNLLSGERELGTLPLLLGQPLPLRRLLAVRLLVRAFVFLGLNLLALVLALAALGGPMFRTRGLALLGLWLAVTVAYGLFWFACAFYVNARGRSSAENGLLLAGLWLLLVVVAPGALNLGLKQLYPMPSRIAYLDEAREATVEVDRKKTELLGKYLIDHPDMVPGGDKAVNVDEYIQTKMAIADETRRILTPLETAFKTQQDRQQRFVDRLRFLSPAVVYQQVGQMLTGNDRGRHQRFLAAAEDHHRSLQEFFFPRFVKDAPDFAAYDAIPRFAFTERSLREELSSFFAAVMGLLIPAFAFAWLGWRRMAKVSIRT